jgi:hypothetical protein
VPDFCPTLGASRCDPLDSTLTQQCADNGAGCNTWQSGDDCVTTMMDNFAFCDSATLQCAVPTPCLTEQPMVSFEPPVVMFVLDKSGSMQTTISGGATSRWNALWNVVDSLGQQFEGSMRLGAKVFPTTDDANLRCEVASTMEVPPALNNHANLISGIPAATWPVNGATPAESGYAMTTDYLRNTANVPATDQKAIIFILDGAISDGRCLESDPLFGCLTIAIACGPLPGHDFPAPTDNEVSSLTSRISTNFNDADSIPTFIVGIDVESGWAGEMNGYANAGGVPNSGPTAYYGTTSQAQLEAELQGILSGLATCDIQLSIPPPNPDLVDVQVGGVQYTQISSTDCMNNQPGWYYSTQYTQITLCGQACDDFKAMSTPTADVSFFCSAG